MLLRRLVEQKPTLMMLGAPMRGQKNSAGVRPGGSRWVSLTMPESPPISESDFLRLFVKHENVLRAFARVLVPTWEAVDEVMQEASVVLWKKLAQLDAAENFLPWAKVIVRYEALEMRRKSARDRHVFSDEILEQLAHEAAETEEDLWEREQSALNGCLEKMVPHHRELVLAPYVEHGRVAQLAGQTGRTINSLYKLLGRLRKTLMECVENSLAKEGLS